MNEVPVIYISFDLPSSYQTAKDGSSQYNNHGAGQAKNNRNAVGKLKKRQRNRKKYIKNLLKKTF